MQSVRPKRRPRVTLLHGVAEYPAKLKDMNMRALEEMGVRYLECEIGISDHTVGWMAGVMCATLGGKMIEKHFKIDDSIRSPDMEHSATAMQMQTLVKRVREAEGALGTGEKNGPLECERPLFETCRRSNDKPLRG